MSSAEPAFARRPVLLGVTLALMAASIAWEFGGSLPDGPTNRAEHVRWISLQPGVELSQTFTTPWNDFQSVQVRAKGEGDLSGTLHIEIDRMTPRPAGVLESGIRRAQTMVDEMTGETTVDLRFPPIRDSGGQLYRARFFIAESRGGPLALAATAEDALIFAAGGPDASVGAMLRTVLRGRPPPFSSPLLFWALLAAMSVAVSLLVVAAGEMTGLSLTPFLRILTFRWKAAQILFDAVLIAACYYSAYRIRFDDAAFSNFVRYFAASLPVVIACKLAVFHASGLYDRRGNTFSRLDILAVARAVVAGSILSVFAAVYLYRLEGFSRAVFIIDAALLIGAMSGVRALLRVQLRRGAPFLL